MSDRKTYSINLFYSYSHKDERFQTDMEKALSLLHRDNLITSWSDHKILPGQNISDSIVLAMKQSEIYVSLLSQDFIASDACMEEWNEVKKLCIENPTRCHIPIILTPCAWQDLLQENNIKALPKDGNPVESYDSQNAAWQEIYEGIKSVALGIRGNFAVKSDFLHSLENTELVSQDHIKLQDIFVFPTLTNFSPTKKSTKRLKLDRVTNVNQILEQDKCVIFGDAMGGKSALAKYLFLDLLKNSKPVMFVDLETIHQAANEQTLKNLYGGQFHGDYSLWKNQDDKTIIFDNLSSAPKTINLVAFSTEHFKNVIVTIGSDIYRSYYWDDSRLAKFRKLKIEPLSHSQQEILIRNRLKLMDSTVTVKDGIVDQIENQVNLVIDNRIIPRYPFYVLSIVQTVESFMPRDLKITAYGHCYYIWIIARLIKSGVPNQNDEINACMNFAEYIAFEIYQRKILRKIKFSEGEFTDCICTYRKSFIIQDSLLHRLTNSEYGILSKDGQFSVPFMYYYFLGAYLSKNEEKHKEIIEELSKRSYESTNYLVLLFTIHHGVSYQILENILLMTMCTLDTVKPAQLTPDETQRFQQIVSTLPKNLLSNDDVADERKRERDSRDAIENETQPNDSESMDDELDGAVGLINDSYRILKNNEILGQVLKSEYGRLERKRITEIIEVIVDGGLRLVNVVLSSEEEIHDLANYVKEVYPDGDFSKIKFILKWLSFIWTMTNIESVVSAINHKQLNEMIGQIVTQKSNQAYDIIDYFCRLDSSDELTETLHNRLAELIDKYDDPFIKGVLSNRTQFYMNTHRSRSIVEQRFHSTLKLTYKQGNQPIPVDHKSK